MELGVTMVLLSFTLLVCFALFTWGSRAAFQGQTRAGLQAESRKISLAIRNDVMRADYDLTEVLDGRTALNPQGETVPRHAMSSVALSNWSDPSNFDPDQAVPRWDRFFVLYANGSSPGLLVKQTYPASGPVTNPMANLSAYLNDDPSANGALNTNVLTRSLEAFRILADEQSHRLSFRVLLASRGGRKGLTSRLNERYEMVLDVRLENSAPL